jgi:hypothetical protein
VVKKTVGQHSKSLIERGTYAYQIELKECYMQMNTVQSLSELVEVFNERMLWAPYAGTQGDLLRDGDVKYAVCIDARDGVVVGI